MEKSLWILENKETPSYPKLTENIEVDVAIIGGGITGVTSALQLINHGKKVAIIEAHKMGGMTSSASTGNLYVPIQPHYHTILDKFNLKTAIQVADSRQWAIKQIEKNIAELNIECHFARRPWFAYALNKTEVLDQEYEAFKKINLEVNYTSELPFDLPFKKAINLTQQARFNPLQYVLGITQYLAEKGCIIFEKTPVMSISENKIPIIHTQQGTITAKNIIIATHTPININKIQSYTAPYRSYIIAATSAAGPYPDVHCWNFDKHLINSLSTHGVSQNSPDILILAGQHHKTGQGKSMKTHFVHLSEYLNKYFADSKIEYQWSAQHYHTADALPYIGHAHSNKRNIYMATGYFADGLVYGTLAAHILSSAILDKKLPFTKIYQPSRHTFFASLPFLLKENLNVLTQYLKDLPWQNKDNKPILPDEARIIEIEGQKYAAYRDLENKLHTVSAVCTHMKCIVNWNNAEKTWDCPCHGSRFTTTGQVIEGPATCELKQYKGILS